VTQLTDSWKLGDVRDVEKLCRSILDAQLRRFGAYLQHDDYEDAIADLFVHVWKMWSNFDPKRRVLGRDGHTRPASFAGFVSANLPLRIADIYRARFGRSGAHRPPEGSCSLAELDPHDAELVLNAGDDEEHHDATGLLDALSPEAQRMALALLEGYARAELQRGVGITTKAASAQHERLREEVAWHLKGAA
jgi:hypothetical protein